MSNVSMRIARLEVEQTERATKALGYVAQRYGLSETELAAAAHLKRLVSPTSDYATQLLDWADEIEYADEDEIDELITQD
jgi:hypothetical protein